MSLTKRIASAAAECVRTPGRISIWSESHGRYICSEHPDFDRLATKQQDASAQGHAPLGATFKLVFLTAAVGTVLFTLICVTTTLLAGRNPPPLLQEVVRALADLAKIGFGAIVGMLGGQSLRR
jgi:hypothetical protein